MNIQRQIEHSWPLQIAYISLFDKKFYYTSVQVSCSHKSTQ